MFIDNKGGEKLKSQVFTLIAAIVIKLLVLSNSEVVCVYIHTHTYTYMYVSAIFISLINAGK